MNIFYRAVSVLSLVLSFHASKAQISLGAHGSYMYVLGGTELRNVGAGIRADFPLSEKFIITGSASYYFTSGYNDFIYGYNRFGQDQIMIDAEHTYSFIHGNVGGKFYLAGDYEEEYGFYLLVEAGVLVAPYKLILGEYDDDTYNLAVNAGETEILGNFTINAGLGFEKKIDFGYVFLEVKANLPAETYNSRTGYYYEIIPAAINGSLGFRFRL